MSQQTIISVPSWAYQAVGNYMNNASDLSGGLPNTPFVLVTSGYGARGQAIIDGSGALVGVQVMDQGFGYSEPPLVLISANDTTGAGATATATVSGGKLTGITVTTSGMGYVTIPTVTLSPSGLGAEGEAVVTGNVISAVTLVNGGNNYSTPPAVEILGGRGAGATAHAVLPAVPIATIEITNSGNYLSSPPTVTFSSGAATATVNMRPSPDDWAVESLTITNYGSYTVPPTVIFTAGSITAVALVHLTPSSVASFVVDTGGSGYANAAPPISVYAGTIIAPQDSNETGAIAKLAARGAGGNATVTGAYALADGIIKGNNLTGLPSSLNSNISSKEIAAFALVSNLIGKKSFFAGDPDITLLAQALTLSTPTTYLNRLTARIENDNYHAERASMDVALGLGIDLASQAVLNADVLRKSGLYAREYLQGTYELLNKLYIEQEEINVYKLEIFGNALRAITGSQQTTSSSDNGPSPFMQAVGITTTAIGAYNAIAPAGTLGSLLSSLFVAEEAVTTLAEVGSVAAVAAA